jgi:hypothetical protein
MFIFRSTFNPSVLSGQKRCSASQTANASISLSRSRCRSNVFGQSMQTQFAMGTMILAVEFSGPNSNDDLSLFSPGDNAANVLASSNQWLHLEHYFAAD